MRLRRYPQISGLAEGEIVGESIIDELHAIRTGIQTRLPRHWVRDVVRAIERGYCISPHRSVQVVHRAWCRSHYLPMVVVAGGTLQLVATHEVAKNYLSGIEELKPHRIKRAKKDMEWRWTGVPPARRHRLLTAISKIVPVRNVAAVSVP